MTKTTCTCGNSESRIYPVPCPVHPVIVERVPQTTDPLDRLIPVRVFVVKTSQIVGLLAGYSLLLGCMTGVAVIHPLISITLLIASGGFYLMTKVRS